MNDFYTHGKRSLRVNRLAVCRSFFWALFSLTAVICFNQSSLLPELDSVAIADNPPIANSSEVASKATLLLLKASIKREISPNDVHFYKVEVPEGHFFSLEIEQWGVNLSGIISGSKDPQRIEFTCRTSGASPVSVIAERGGEYLLALRAPAGAGKVGSYRIRLNETRLKSTGDIRRIAVEKVLAEADRLRATQKDDSYRQAIGKYQEALVSLEEFSDYQLKADIFKGLGQTYEALNDNQSAFANYNQALSLNRRVRDQKFEADVLNCLGYLDVSIGNNRKALSTAESALRLSRLKGHSSGEAQALFVSGEAHYGLGDLQKALEFYQQALVILRTLNDYRAQAETLLNVGYTHSSLSRTAESRQAYLESVSLSRDSQDLRLQAKSLRALATFQTRLGEYQQALDLFAQALLCLNIVDDRLTRATIYGGMTFTYKNLGELHKALDYSKQSIRLFQEIKNAWGEGEAQMDSGRVSFALGDGNAALASYQRALTLFRELGMTRLQAQTLRDIGAVYDSWNDHTQALNYYTQSLQLTRPGQDQRYRAYTLNYIGRVLEVQGSKLKAQEYYRQALELNRLAEDPAGEALSLFHLAHVQMDLNLLDESRAQIEASLKISESLRSKVASQDVRASFVASTHQYFELHADVLMRLHRSRPNEGFAGAAFEASEKARARSLLELLKEAHADIRQGVDASLLARERSIGQELNSKAERHAELVLADNKTEAEVVARDVDRLTSDYEQIEAQIRSQSPRYAALTQPQPLTLKEIQQQVLDDESLLLEYMLGDERSYVWAVTRHEIAAFELPGRRQIEDEAFRFHKLLTANQPVPGESAAAHQSRVAEADVQLGQTAVSFSQLVLAPVINRLGKKRLLIVPDGALQYIPFQALVVPASAGDDPASARSNLTRETAGMVSLIVDHEIVNQPSASTLALLVTETRARKTAPKNVAVLADPVFEADDPRIDSAPTNHTARTEESQIGRAVRDVSLSGPVGPIPRLPASGDEADAIMSLTPWLSGFKAIGFQANRATAMSSDLANYRIVHFATHGFINSEHPKLSGVVLSLFDQKGQPQDGFLRLHDIYNLKLPVDLVVLSACNTGLGKDVKGEGLIGLTRGFMYAGASSVVASLWKVDDAATAELMRLFYGYMLRDGLSPAAALRKAQVTMSQQQRWQSPYFWAGFVIQGQYLQTKPPERFPIPFLAVWLVAGGILIAAGTYALKRRRKSVL